jgi:hypothetical protein
MNLQKLADRLNNSLATYSEKDWNYSRIMLIAKPLSDTQTPYMLWCDRLDTTSREGQKQLKRVAEEVKWGDRHSSELGILELVSLRINKALLQCARGENWADGQPVMRLARKQDLQHQGITTAFWYEVQEVAGEDFENR